MNTFLITGMARSGTTLLDKLLASHAQLDVLSQPFPLLYRHLKKIFFNKIGYPQTYYVLNDLFNEQNYYPEDLCRFLKNHYLNSDEINNVFSKMKHWSGQWTSIDSWNWVDAYEPKCLADLYKILLNEYNNKNYVTSIGSKEVLLEEFIPYLSSQGIKIVHIIRDPRDVITSLNIGKGTEFGGFHRPTLFHLRNWRKSIAIAHTMADNENFLSLKYEDLIRQQNYFLKTVTDFLKVEPFEKEYFTNGIPISNGEVWEGNSSTTSFKGIDDSNNGKYKKFLNEDTIRYIEFICGPEMEALGYPLDFNLKNYDPFQFIEPFNVRKNEIHSGMSTDENELSLEFERFTMLKTNSFSEKKVKPLFYSRSNFEILRTFCN